MSAEALERNDGDIEIRLHGDPRAAAKRLVVALNESGDGGLISPRITGTIDFPRVSFRRSRGRFVSSPYARFDGVIRQAPEGSAIVGRVSVPERLSFMGLLIAVPAGFMALVVVLAALSSRQLISVIVAVGFVSVLSGYLLLVRSFGRAGARAESELLVRELREVASGIDETDR